MGNQISKRSFKEYLITFAALVGFVLSLIVHISTYAGIDVAVRFPFVLVLHAGIFIVTIAFALNARKKKDVNEEVDPYFSSYPRWAIFAFIGLFFYVFLNFFITLDSAGHGYPDISDGKYVMRYKRQERRIIEVTKDEYLYQMDLRLRIFSGAWLVAYSVPLVYFFKKKQ